MVGLAFGQDAKQVRSLDRIAKKQNGQKPLVPAFVLKAISVARTLRYSGTRIVEFKSGADRNRHIEYVMKDGPKTRIEFPPDSPNRGQIILEVGGSRYHYLPGRDQVQKTPSRGDVSYMRLAGLANNAKGFRILDSGSATIAGIRARRADIANKSGDVEQSLWIDPKSGLILKRELYDALGSVVGSFQFQSVNLRPTFRPEDFAVKRLGGAVDRMTQKLTESCSQLGFERMAIKPNSGYNLIAVRVINPNGKQPVLMQAYQSKNGLVSLFQVQGRLNDRRLERLAGNKFQHYSWTSGSRTYVLIGDMTESELERISGLVVQR